MSLRSSHKNVRLQNVRRRLLSGGYIKNANDRGRQKSLSVNSHNDGQLDLFLCGSLGMQKWTGLLGHTVRLHKEFLYRLSEASSIPIIFF